MFKPSHQSTFFWLRNLLIVGQLIVWGASNYFWGIEYPNQIVLISLAYFFINLIYRFWKTNPPEFQLFVYLMVDLIELSFFFYFIGGASNPFTWFLLLPIIFSATVLSQKYTWILTSFSILLYTLLIKYFLPSDVSQMEHQHHSTSFSQHLVGMWLGFIVIAVLVAWVIIGLIKSIKTKEYQINKAKLKQSKNDKILSLATLATGSAHELGTPLATINFITDELLSNPDISSYHDQLELLKQQVYRCKESLADITASTGTTQAIQGNRKSIQSFISEIIQSTNISEKINFTKNRIHNLNAEIITDKTLKQAITNIINNAVESGASKVQICLSSSIELLTIDITDNGKGFNQSFDQPKNSEKDFGMGLGLFLAHATIERFKGKIASLKTKQQGSHIQILLPLL